MHTFESDWTYDEVNHWHKATCADKGLVSDKGPHEWGKVVVQESATTESNGKGIKTCATCGYTKEEVIPKLGSYKFADDYILDKVYDKEPYKLDVTKIINSETSKPVNEEDIEFIGYRYQDSPKDAEFNSKPPVNADDYTVCVRINGFELTKDFEIKRRKLKGVLELPEPVQYTGMEYPLEDYELTDEKYGVLPGDTVLLSYIVANKNVGEKVEVVDRGLTFHPNYEYAADFKILCTVIPRKITTPLVVTKAYDGDEYIAYTNWNEVNEVWGVEKDNLILLVKMDKKDAKVSKIEEVQFKYSQGDVITNNYVIDKGLITASITPARLNLSKEYKHVYDGSNEFVLSGDDLIVPTKEDISLYVSMAHKNAGAPIAEYEIKQAVNGSSPIKTDNYHIADEDLKVSIVAKKLEGHLTREFEYNGQEGFNIEDISDHFTGMLPVDGDLSAYKLYVEFVRKDAGSNINYISLKKKETNMAPFNFNYYIDKDDLVLSIKPRRLTVRDIPTRAYNGSDSIDTEELDGVLSGELRPILKIQMSSKNVGASYTSHKLIYTNGDVINYIVEKDAKLEKASITKKVLNFPSYHIPPVASGNKYMDFELGRIQGTASGETVKVRLSNSKASWTSGTNINASSIDSSLMVLDSGNYEVKAPYYDSIVYIMEPSKHFFDTMHELTGHMATIKKDVKVMSSTFERLEVGVEYELEVVDCKNNTKHRDVTIMIGENEDLVAYTSYDKDGNIIFKPKVSSKTKLYIYGLHEGDYSIFYKKVIN